MLYIDLVGTPKSKGFLKAERQKREEMVEKTVKAIQDDMEMVTKEINRLRKRNEEGDEYRCFAHTRDYAMLQHTLNSLAQPNNPK